MLKPLSNSQHQPLKQSFQDQDQQSTRTPLRKNQNCQNFFNTQSERQVTKLCNRKKPKGKQNNNKQIKIKELPQGSSSPTDRKKIDVNIKVHRNFEKLDCGSQYSVQHQRKSSISSNSTFFGGRSTASVFSYRSTSGSKRFLADKTINVQKIDMRKLISKKADLYFDSAFASTLDSLLEQSYQLVQTKKQQFFDLANNEAELQQQIDELVQQVQPLQSQVCSKEENLVHQKETLEKYQIETKDYQEQIFQQDQLRKLTEENIENETQKLFKEIASLEQTASQLQTDINVSKAQHDLTRTKLEQNVASLNQNLGVFHQMLAHSKNIAVEKQSELNEKTRKMENKSKMFIGMLGHF